MPLISGSARYGDRQASTVVVHAFDRDMRHAEPLGQATTDHDGKFEIEYSRKQFRRAEKERADLFIRVLDHNGRELYESETRFNAKDVEVFDIELPADALCDVDEWSWMCAQISAPIEGVALAELTDDDLNFLHRETGFDRARLRMLRIDAAWTCAHGLPHGLFYAMFRQALPTVLPRLLALSPERWREAVKQSIVADIVPTSLGKGLDAALEKLEDLADEIALSGKDDEGGLPAVATLAIAPLSDDQRRIFARALRRSGPTGQARWDALFEELATNRDFGEKAVAEARFVLEAEKIVFAHLPTLRALETHRRGRQFRIVADLAKTTRDEWRAIAKAGAADGLPPQFEDAAAFATRIAHRVEMTFPSGVIAARFEHGEAPERTDVARFIADNPRFNVLTDSVSRAVEDGTVGNLREPEKLVPRLKAVARTARVVASLDANSMPESGLAGGVEGLLTAGFDSARKIINTPKGQFAERLGPLIGGDAVEGVYNGAAGRIDAAEMVRNHLRDYIHDPVWVIPSIDWSAPPEDWSFLFEGPAGCECKHCRSVLSPAAYLADLLKTLEDSPGAPYDELNRRRPDIPETKLSCTNANTPLPYIDLVNEILSDAVMGERVAARDTIGDADERRALPTPIHPEADGSHSRGATEVALAIRGACQRGFRLGRASWRRAR